MSSNSMLISCMVGIAIVVSAAVALYIDFLHFLLHFINTIFYIALCFILLGGFLFVFERGFFNITHYAFQKVFKVTNKKVASLIEEPRLDDRDMLYITYSFRLTYPLLITGLLLGSVSMIISFAVFV